MKRKDFLKSLGALGLSGLIAPAWSQAWPSRPVRIIVAFAPGGGLDVLARLLADPMERDLGQPVVVENRPGAAGAIGTRELMRSVPDGHTVMLGNVGQLSVLEHLSRDAVPDVARSVSGVGQIGTAPLGLFVPATSRARTASDFLKLLRAEGDSLNFGSAGSGQISHLGFELLKLEVQGRITHVPYKGSAAAVNDLLGGRINAILDALGVGMPHVKSGRLRLLAVTSPSRLPDVPDVPTLIESGVPNFTVSGWQGIVAPRNTPAPVVSRLNAALNAALRRPEVAERMAAFGFMPAPSTPEAFGELMLNESARWGRVVRAAGIKGG